MVAELKARNPGLDGTSRHTIESAKVTELTLRPYDGTVAVTDLTPLRALPDLKTLHLWNVSGVENLEVLKGLQLTGLTLAVMISRPRCPAWNRCENAPGCAADVPLSD